MVTDAVAAVEPTGVRTSDGTLHEADVLIWGTGFAATDFLRTIRVVGRDGVELHDVWRDGATAYLGIGVPGFPNLFCIYGPNTNLGGSSIIGMMEAQAGLDRPGRAADRRQRPPHLRGAPRRGRALRPRDAVAARPQRVGRAATTGTGTAAGSPRTGRGWSREYQDRLAQVDWSALVYRAEARQNG